MNLGAARSFDRNNKPGTSERKKIELAANLTQQQKCMTLA
jgi:hypothetical protein